MQKQVLVLLPFTLSMPQFEVTMAVLEISKSGGIACSSSSDFLRNKGVTFLCASAYSAVLSSSTRNFWIFSTESESLGFKPQSCHKLSGSKQPAKEEQEIQTVPPATEKDAVKAPSLWDTRWCIQDRLKDHLGQGKNWHETQIHWKPGFTDSTAHAPTCSLLLDFPTTARARVL